MQQGVRLQHNIRQFICLNPKTNDRVICILYLVIVFATLHLFTPTFEWGWLQLTRTDANYHLLVSASVLLIGSIRLLANRQSFGLASTNLIATLVVLGAATAHLLNHKQLQLDALSAALFLLYCYGLLGHFIAAERWRRCFLPFFIAMLALPFEGYLDIFLGFPLRLMAADASVALMHLLGISSVSTDTVLLIENKAAIVDLDCSGIKGFWIGSFGFCALTWVENYKVNHRWFVLAMVTAVLLFAGNVFRIVTLVMLDLVANRPELARQMHESIGLIAFAFVMFLSWKMLRTYADHYKNDQTNSLPLVSGPKTVYLTLLLLLIPLTTFALIRDDTSREYRTLAGPEIERILPRSQFKQVALNKVETDFFNHSGAKAFKYSSTPEYKGKAYEASVLLVWGGSWKSQHKPEHCYLAQGFELSSSFIAHFGDLKRRDSIAIQSIPEIKTVTSGFRNENRKNTSFINNAPDNASFSFRQLALTKPSETHANDNRFISQYWFQSAKTTTPNYAHRVFSQIIEPVTPWTMVSVLWRDGTPLEVQNRLIKEIRLSIHKNINTHG